MKSSTTAAAALLAAAVTLPVWAQDEFGDESNNDAAAEETAAPQESAAADEAPADGSATASYEDSAAATELAQADTGSESTDDGAATEGDSSSAEGDAGTASTDAEGTGNDSADASAESTETGESWDSTETTESTESSEFSETTESTESTESDSGDGAMASELAPSEGSTDDGSGQTGESVSGESYGEESYATESYATDSYAADSYGEDSGETAEAEEEPGHYYVGVDRARATLSFSDASREAQFGGDEPRSDFYRVRVGTRLFDAIGLEGHYAIADSKDDEEDRFEVDKSYGVYLVPTGVILDVLEIAVPVGYNVFSAKRGQAETELDGVSYGVNFEVPVVISESMPELRLGGGGMVYQAHERQRVYGYHFGVRLDFTM